MKYEFKYRLSQKSSFAQVIKAARACNFSLTVDYTSICFSGTKDEDYFSRFVRLEDVPEWLNGQLEDRELLKPLAMEE